MWLRRRGVRLCIAAARGVSGTPSNATTAAEATTTAVPADGPSSSIEWQVEKLAARVAALERVVQQHDDAVQLQERQRTVLERRMGDLEENVSQLHSQVIEANRVAGEVALEQRNVDVLVQGLEQRVLHGNLGGVPAADTRENVPARDVSVTCTADAVVAALRAALNDAALRAELHRTLAPVCHEVQVDATNTPTESVEGVVERRQLAAVEQVQHALRASLHGLEARVNALQTRLAQSTMDALAVERVTPVVDAVARATSPEAAAAVVTRGLGIEHDGGAITPAHSGDDAARACLRRLRACGAAVSFRDAAGVLRASSERILVRQVPANMSAAEVRELCLQCCSTDRTSSSDGDVEGLVVSCVARRMHVTDVPCGDQADEAVYERAFEVTFSSATVALRALQELNRCTLRAAAKQPPRRVVAEPILSAELTEALRQLQSTAPASTERQSTPDS